MTTTKRVPIARVAPNETYEVEVAYRRGGINSAYVKVGEAATEGGFSFEDLNGLPTQTSGPLASRPMDGGVVNSTFSATDTGQEFRWTGSAWVLVADIALPGVIALRDADVIPRREQFTSPSGGSSALLPSGAPDNPGGPGFLIGGPVNSPSPGEIFRLDKAIAVPGDRWRLKATVAQDPGRPPGAAALWMIKRTGGYADTGAAFALAAGGNLTTFESVLTVPAGWSGPLEFGLLLNRASTSALGTITTDTLIAVIAFSVEKVTAEYYADGTPIRDRQPAEAGATLGARIGETLFLGGASSPLPGTEVLNTSVVPTGTAAARPASGAFTGQTYFASDTRVLSRWSGAVWVDGPTRNTGALANVDTVDLAGASVTGVLPVAKADTGLRNSELLPAIDAAADTALWSGVSGFGKPENNADVTTPARVAAGRAELTVATGSFATTIIQCDNSGTPLSGQLPRDVNVVRTVGGANDTSGQTLTASDTVGHTGSVIDADTYRITEITGNGRVAPPGPKGGLAAPPLEITVLRALAATTVPLSLHVSWPPFAQGGVPGSGNGPTVTTNSVTVLPLDGVSPYTYAWTKEPGGSLQINVTTNNAATTTFTGGHNAANLTRKAAFRCTVTDSSSPPRSGFSLVDAETYS